MQQLLSEHEPGAFSVKRIDFILGERDIIEIVRIFADCDQRGALVFFSTHLESASQGLLAGETSITNTRVCDVIVKGDSVKALKDMVGEEDEEGCLAFLREHFEKEIKQVLTPCCVPVFEASYKPSQAEHYATDADKG